VETNAFQYVVAENLRKLSMKTGAYVPIKEINQYHDKKLRVEGIIPLLIDGTIVFDSQKARNNQQYNMAIDQLCSFTGEQDEHDDFPDCLEMCVEIAKKPRFKVITRQNKKNE
jgi:predicted phage terminase large subunit-like protein